MKLGGKRIFTVPENKEKLFELINAGHSANSVAKYFDCDHTTILFNIKKYGLRLTKYRAKRAPVSRRMRPEVFGKHQCQKCGMLLRSEYHMKYPC